MASEKKAKQGVSRRGFIAACGAAVASTTVPRAAQAGTLTGWASAKRMAAALVAAYLAEVERFTEELRPRFESGEVGAWDGNDTGPTDRLEELCAERFGLQVTKIGWGEYEGGDLEQALLILFVSPSSDSVDRGANWAHECLAAAAAVATDVLASARRCGWVPPETE